METDEYLKLAEVEDRMWYFRSLHGHLARELARGGVGPGASVLDAGCGTGGLIVRWKRERPSWRVSGVDIMPLACRLARERCGSGTDIREGSITALPFGEGEFDGIVSADVVCQVDRAADAIAEFFRVLRRGGVAAINVPAYMWLWSYHDDAVHTKHRFTRGEMKALLEAAGFSGVRVTHWNALPFPLVWGKRKLFRTARDTSDVKLYPAPLELAFNATMAVEHAWLRAGGRWAWGSSVLAVGRKP
jgi:SAM-dependent methyltransferase